MAAAKSTLLHHHELLKEMGEKVLRLWVGLPDWLIDELKKDYSEEPKSKAVVESLHQIVNDAFAKLEEIQESAKAFTDHYSTDDNVEEEMTFAEVDEVMTALCNGFAVFREEYGLLSAEQGSGWSMVELAAAKFTLMYCRGLILDTHKQVVRLWVQLPKWLFEAIYWDLEEEFPTTSPPNILQLVKPNLESLDKLSTMREQMTASFATIIELEDGGEVDVPVIHGKLSGALQGLHIARNKLQQQEEWLSKRGDLSAVELKAMEVTITHCMEKVQEVQDEIKDFLAGLDQD